MRQRRQRLIDRVTFERRHQGKTSFNTVAAAPAAASSSRCASIARARLAESLGTLIGAFGCLTVVWILVAIGFRRH